MRKHNDISIDGSLKKTEPKIHAISSDKIRESKRRIKEPQFEEPMKCPLPALSTVKSKVKEKEYEAEEDKWSDTDGFSVSVTEEKNKRAQLPDSDLVAIELSNLISSKNALQSALLSPSPTGFPNFCPSSSPCPLNQATTNPVTKHRPSSECRNKKEF